MKTVIIIGVTLALYFTWVLSTLADTTVTSSNGDVVNYKSPAVKVAQVTPTPTPTAKPQPVTRQEYLREQVIQKILYPDDLRHLGGGR